GRRGRGGARGENAEAVERAAIANHLEEACVVARGRQQPGAARETLARAVDVIALTARTVRRARDLAAARRRARVHRREAVALRRRQEELRVLHAERTGDARADQLVERHARRALGDAAQD